jgi:hypothetical protein
MGKKKGGIHSAGDAPVTEVSKPGKGYVNPKVVKEGEYAGVDRDADVLSKPGKGFKK